MQFHLRPFNLWQIVLTSPLLALVTILAGCQADTSPIIGSIYTANEEGNSISVVDASANRLLATVPAGEEPHNIQVAPDRKTVWVTNCGAGDVWVLDAATLKLIVKIPSLSVIDTVTDKVIGTIKVGEEPNGVSFSTRSVRAEDIVGPSNR